MKKAPKPLIKKYLLNHTYSYKELAKITGYHEKSLIRFQSQIKAGTFKEHHGNLNKTPHNKITDSQKENILKLYESQDFKNKKEFYDYLIKQNIKISYSALCKIIPKKIKVFAKPLTKQNEKRITRKLIKDNLIQYKCIRYEVISQKKIPHLSKATLVLDSNFMPQYLLYKNKKYNLKKQKELVSVKGNTKYS